MPRLKKHKDKPDMYTNDWERWQSQTEQLPRKNNVKNSRVERGNVLRSMEYLSEHKSTTMNDKTKPSVSQVFSSTPSLAASTDQYRTVAGKYDGTKEKYKCQPGDFNL